MNDMRIKNYEWYENNKIMNDMRIYILMKYIYIYIYSFCYCFVLFLKFQKYINSKQKAAPCFTDHFAYWMKFVRVLFEG